MEVPTDLREVHEDLLAPESLSSSSSESSSESQAQAFLAWQNYVSDEITNMLMIGVSPSYLESWMLRKAVRAHLPHATIKHLYDTGPQKPEWVAQNAEALRYALVDGTLDEQLTQLFQRSPTKAVPVEAILGVATFAAMANKWDFALTYAMALLAQGAGDEFARAVVVMDSLGMPQENRTEAFRAGLNGIVPQAYELLHLDTIERILRQVREKDDADNYLSLDGYHIAGPGIGVSDDAAATTPLMSDWLRGIHASGDRYLDRLGVVLSRRFTDFKLVGSGAFGVVLVASRDAKRYAIKLTRLVDPLGKTTDADRQMVQHEVDINLAIAASPQVHATLAYMPLTLDWTRGRMDVVKVLRNLTGQRDVQNPLLVPGAGIYMVQVMPAFNFTLYAWMFAAERAAGTNAAAYRAFIDMLVPMFTVLLAQLFVLRATFPGFKHTDLKSDNVLLYRVNRPEEMTTPFVSVRLESLVPIATPRGLLQVLPAHTGNYAPSISDFGLASMTMPTSPSPVVLANRVNTDFKAIALMVPVEWPDASGTLRALRRWLLLAPDNGSPQDVAALFQSVSHTGNWLTNFLLP